MGDKAGEGKRSTQVVGNVIGSTLISGDGNVVRASARVDYRPVSLPSRDQVDIAAEVAALKALLAGLDTTDARKIRNALEDAESELAKAEPDPDEIGRAIDRGLEYGKRARNFVEILDALEPHVKRAAAWLGSNWYKILAFVGLSAA